MTQILVNVIQGFSARRRPERATIGHLVQTVLAPFKNKVHINIENSSDRRCICRSMRFLDQSRGPVLLIGKSLGGVRLWWMLKKHAAELARHLSVHCIFIDPHGWQVGDGVVGSHGKNRALPYFREFDQFDMVNLYQHNKWPHGAVFEGQDFNRKLGPGADHWNCADLESGESAVVRGLLLD